jgi:hypothetical protein
LSGRKFLSAFSTHAAQGEGVGTVKRPVDDQGAELAHEHGLLNSLGLCGCGQVSKEREKKKERERERKREKWRERERERERGGAGRLTVTPHWAVARALENF